MKSQGTTGKLFLLAFTLAFASAAPAGPVLTSAGSTAGFGLTRFAYNFPTQTIGGLGVGPLGIAFPIAQGGPVMVSDSIGNVRIFAIDVDNQDASTASIATPGGSVVGPNYGNLGALGLAKAGNFVFATNQPGGEIRKLNLDGTFNSSLTTGITNATGITFNPTDGNLYVTTVGNGIWRVNPSTGAKFKLSHTGNLSFDGLIIDATGTKLYAAESNSVRGYDLLLSTQFFTTGTIPGDPDGVELGYGNLANEIFVNFNNGELWQFNLSNPSSKVMLTTGGTRGDFVAADGCSLLFTQSSEIWRLGTPTGGCIGVNTTPEPSSLWLVALPLLAMGRKWIKYSNGGPS